MTPCRIPHPDMDRDTLVGILRAYDASVDAAAVRAALSGPDSVTLQRWAHLHLAPDTLLTADELTQSVLPFLPLALSRAAPDTHTN